MTTAGECQKLCTSLARFVFPWLQSKRSREHRLCVCSLFCPAFLPFFTLHHCCLSTFWSHRKVYREAGRHEDAREREKSVVPNRWRGGVRAAGKGTKMSARSEGVSGVHTLRANVHTNLSTGGLLSSYLMADTCSGPLILTLIRLGLDGSRPDPCAHSTLKWQKHQVKSQKEWQQSEKLSKQGTAAN